MAHSSGIRCLGQASPCKSSQTQSCKITVLFPNPASVFMQLCPVCTLPFCHVTCFCQLHLQWSLFQGKPGCLGTMCLLSLPLSLAQGVHPAPGLLSVFAGPLGGLPDCTWLPVFLPAASGTMSSLVSCALGFLVVPEGMLPPWVWAMEGFVHTSWPDHLAPHTPFPCF